MRPTHLALGALVLLSSTGALPDAGGAAPSGTGALAGAPDVLFLGEAPGATSLGLFVSGPASGREPTPIATLGHPSGAAVAARVIADREVAVVFDRSLPPDLSFAGALAVVGPGHAPRILADQVVHASRPVVTADRRVLVARGQAGATPPPGVMRIDSLRVDEIDPRSGATHTLASLDGYGMFVIGEREGEALIYEVSPDQAAIVAVSRASGKVRSLATVPPFARDFSLEGDHVTFVDRHATDARTWEVLTLDARRGTLAHRFASASVAMVPHALPGGDVMLTLEAGRGPTLLRGGSLVESDALDRALGPGVAHVADISADDRFVTGISRLPGKLGHAYLLDLARGAAQVIPTVDGERITIAGFDRSGTPGAAKAGAQ